LVFEEKGQLGDTKHKIINLENMTLRQKKTKCKLPDPKARKLSSQGLIIPWKACLAKAYIIKSC
jgi:hypothetical protein